MVVEKYHFVFSLQYHQFHPIDGMIGSKSIFYLPIRPSRQDSEEENFEE